MLWDVSAAENFTVQVPQNGGWKDLPDARIFANQYKDVRIQFNTPVVSDRFRLRIEDAGPRKQSNVREWTFWKSGEDKLPPLRVLSPPTQLESKHPQFDMKTNLIFLNQAGFNTEWPKRFTAPLTPDGTNLSIFRKDTPTKELFSGLVQQRIGDFSAFRPVDNKDVEYTVNIEGGGLKNGVSDPFSIAPFLMQKETLEPMLRFFVDDRSLLGTVFGGLCNHPWRDSPTYAYSMPSLVHLLLSNPSYYLQQEVEMDWKKGGIRLSCGSGSSRQQA